MEFFSKVDDLKVADSCFRFLKYKHDTNGVDFEKVFLKF